MPKQLRTVKVRVYPTPEQRKLLAQTFGCCRLVYNLALEQRSTYGRRGRRISFVSWSAELKSLKVEADFLRDVPHHCLVQALKDLDSAYARFFSGQNAYPKPRRKFDNQSCRFPDPLQFTINRQDIVLPKLGSLKMIAHRPIQGHPRQITIVREGDHYYAAILTKVRTRAPEERERSEGGYDVGIKQPVVESDGTVHAMPLMTVQEQRRKARLHRSLSRKQKNSKNRTKARRALARFEARIARRRRDAAHQISHRLTKKYTHLACENLRLKNMTASASGTVEEPGRNVALKAGLNRALLDVAPGQLRRMVAYKAAWRGGILVAVDPARSSQECSECGHVAAENRPTRDLFQCVACGFTADADVNAARVIRARGRQQWSAPQDTTAPGPGVAACPALCSKTRRRSRKKDPGRHGLPQAA